MNTYEPEWNYGPAFFDARHNFVFSANYELPFGKGRRWGSDASAVADAILGGWRLSGIFQARTGFPITVTDGRGSLAAGAARQRAAELRRRSGAGRPEHRALAGHQRLRSACRSAPGATVASASRGRLATRTSTPCWPSGSASAATRYFEFRAEAFNLTNTPSFGPPARDINAPNTFGTITSTVSTARTVELVLKFFF